MTAVAGRVVSEKATKGRGGTRWNTVVEKVWKDIEGNQENVLSIERFGGHKTEVNVKDRNKGKTSSAEEINGKRRTLERCTRSQDKK